MIQDEQDHFILHGKTGTRLSDLGLGWYVGFIETDKGTWVFAVNFDGTGTEAKNIALEVLKEKKFLNRMQLIQRGKPCLWFPFTELPPRRYKIFHHFSIPLRLHKYIYPYLQAQLFDHPPA